MAIKIYLSPSKQTANTYAAGNTNEAVQCRKIAAVAAAALKRCGFDVKVAGDAATVNQRNAESNNCKANLHVPIHTNAGGGKGCEVFVYSTADSNMKYAKPIYDELVKVAPSKTARYIGTYRYGGTLGEIEGTTAVCVYCECEFHDNKTYADYIIKNTTTFGEAICKGICKGFGVTYKTAATPAPAAKVLDKTGFKKGENNNGIFAVKRLMMLGKKFGLVPNNLDNNGSFGGGTQTNTNACLKRWGYAQNGIIGTNFINKLADEVASKIGK
ncbi:MAG: N-acetylmuramoyl-L-alanine amidase [Oscillospiraceae bacterium]|jgi:N-acetylmuramoyl-L-alanine amidase|nr:N-acetylmuramoyl-L-alanine amidase [Oscillospiraceae bacterium]